MGVAAFEVPTLAALRKTTADGIARQEELPNCALAFCSASRRLGVESTKTIHITPFTLRSISEFVGHYLLRPALLEPSSATGLSSTSGSARLRAVGLRFRV